MPRDVAVQGGCSWSAPPPFPSADSLEAKGELSCPSNVYLLTDASDQAVRTPGTQLKAESDNDLVRLGSPVGQHGRYRLEIWPSADLSFGTRINLKARFSRPEVFEVATPYPCRLEIVAPPPPWKGNDPPTLLKFKSRSGQMHVRRGGSRITLETDAKDDFLMNGGRVDAYFPSGSGFPVAGISGPSRGEVRVGLRIPDDYPLGPAGQIKVEMTLTKGIELFDTATLVVDERGGTGGSTSQIVVPAYVIHDVREIKVDEGDFSWADMPGILGDGSVWTAQDVGAYYIQESDNDRVMHFYLNAENRVLKQAEQRVAHQRSEAGVDTLREFQRTVLCGHLYAIATTRSRNSLGAESPYGYRDEMIRVNSTALFAQQQFLAVLDLNAS